MNSIEQRLDAIESRFAMSELRSKYAWYVARGMSNELADLFTEDGVFETSNSAGKGIVGREALRKDYVRLEPGLRVPLITNEVFQIDGDTARGTCAMQSPISASASRGAFCGHYIDEFRRVDGKWLFSKRSFYRYWPKFAPSSDTRP